MKKFGIGGKIASHITALLLGALLTFGTLKVMSSQAEPLSLTPKTSVPETSVTETKTSLQAQNNNSAQFSTNFVASAIARTGPAVVRIDTERTVTRRVDPLFEDPFSVNFSAIALDSKFLEKDKLEVKAQDLLPTKMELSSPMPM